MLQFLKYSLAAGIVVVMLMVYFLIGVNEADPSSVARRISTNVTRGATQSGRPDPDPDRSGSARGGDAEPKLVESVAAVGVANSPSDGEGPAVISGESCPDLSTAYNFSGLYDGTDDWQTVTDGVLYVYSAHADPRRSNDTVIRVFGIMLRTAMAARNRRRYYLQVLSEGSHHVHSIEARLRTVLGHNSSKLKMVELACPFPCNPWLLPRTIVSITSQPCAEPNNHLIVRQNYKQGLKTNFSLCLDGVLKHGTTERNRLIEWIELNRMLGAEHIFVYNFTGSSRLEPHLRYYERRGLLTLLPWNLPITFREEEDEFSHDFFIVWNYAQRTMIHDCLYRNMFVARHLVYLDLDEFIIPQEADVWTWREMMERAKENCTGNIGCYCARNGVFEMDARYAKTSLITAAYTTMHTRMRRPFARTKYIIIPERVRYLNVHAVEEYDDLSYTACVMETSVGHMHHYKVLNKNKSKQQNTAAVKYKSELLKRIQSVHHYMKT